MPESVDSDTQPDPIGHPSIVSNECLSIVLAAVGLVISLAAAWTAFDNEIGVRSPPIDVRLVATDASAAEKDYPPGQLGEAIRLGETLVNETNKHPLTKSLVGNSLSCTSCHLDAGRHPEAASFIGVAAAYPAYSPREKSVITLEDRIANCFIRSQNGSRPKNGSEALVAIAAYITWLSEGTPIRMNPAKPLGPNHMVILAEPKQRPSIERGQTLYEDRCAFCHGDNGSGSDDGPPVWGDDSFNDGAGLTGIPKMASWLKVAMPLDDTDLTDQESFDIAAYVNSHDRPKFRGTQPNNDANNTRNPTTNEADK
ncbi:SoxAX cytochrome complex subunit A precursor [Crateriforma conspicua]|uniref:SoxAX cytochrome complex subunit A n=2 Tax=Planctomycetaceae TaxID=126 RepID=A0A5C6FNM4_9PLAN|nr:SoxAX cytochrome complex subunit A precursor [Crateriforma conspicua]